MRRSIIALALLSALGGPAVAGNEASAVKSAEAFCSFNGYSKVPCGVAVVDHEGDRGVAFSDGTATIMFVGSIINEHSSGVSGVIFSEEEFYEARSGVCFIKPESLTCTALVQGIRITATATRED